MSPNTTTHAVCPTSGKERLHGAAATAMYGTAGPAGNQNATVPTAGSASEILQPQVPQSSHKPQTLQQCSQGTSSHCYKELK